MNLREALGDQFREDMTLEEAAAALESYNPTEGLVDKSLLQKANTEAANYKKQLRAKQTEDEQREAERAAEHESVMAELAELRRDKAVGAYTTEFLKAGYDESLATETAKALYDGKVDVVFSSLKKVLEAQRKAMRAELLKETPRTPADAAAPGGLEYDRLIDDARARGDMSAVAYYTRLKSQKSDTHQ